MIPIVNPAEELIQVAGLEIRFLVTGDQSNGTAAAFEMVVPGGQAVPAPAHSHDHYEETIYGLDNVLTWTVDGNRVEVGPGQMLCIPRGAVHRFDNFTAANARALCVLTPAAIGPQYFREMAAELASGAPDKAKLVEIMLRHGLRPAPPQAH
jgi:quercetin dioxygenase-like cupin family protein